MNNNIYNNTKTITDKNVEFIRSQIQRKNDYNYPMFATYCTVSNVITDMDWDTTNQKTKITNMWAIINKGGAANARHHHGNSSLSAAYYVRAPKNSGDIVFYDPRPAPVYSHPVSNKPNYLNAMQHSISPLEGLLVMFPGYLDHSVNENLSNEERIVISFNISLLNHY